MGLNYDFYPNPLPDDDGKHKLHARVVPSGTLRTDAIAEMIHGASTLSTADVKGVLTALTCLMADQLSDGYRIHLEGLGYFQLTLSCPPVYSPKEIRAESIQVKSVVFKPEAGMKKKFKALRCVRAKEKRHSHPFSMIEIEEILFKYFINHEYITCREFQRICGLTASTAYLRLKKLISDGKLKQSGLHNSLYMPVKEERPG